MEVNGLIAESKCKIGILQELTGIVFNLNIHIYRFQLVFHVDTWVSHIIFFGLFKVVPADELLSSSVH